MLELFIWKSALLCVSDEQAGSWLAHVCSSYTSVMHNTYSVIKPAASQSITLWSDLRSLLFLNPSFSLGLCFFFPSVESCGVWMEQRKGSLMVSQKIAGVEKPECKGRELESESPGNSIRLLTLKKTTAHAARAQVEFCWAPSILTQSVFISI